MQLRTSSHVHALSYVRASHEYRSSNAPSSSSSLVVATDRHVGMYLPFDIIGRLCHATCSRTHDGLGWISRMEPGGTHVYAREREGPATTADAFCSVKLNGPAVSTAREVYTIRQRFGSAWDARVSCAVPRWIHSRRLVYCILHISDPSTILYTRTRCWITNARYRVIRDIKLGSTFPTTMR